LYLGKISFSKRSVFNPDWPATRPADDPEGPPPMIIKSYIIRNPGIAGKN
jgi:hypothetical protein